MKPLTHRQILIELLRTHHHALHAWNPGSTGNGVTLMPSLYHQGSYAELERRLADMRDDRLYRQAWWHLSHRYRWGTTHRETVPCRRTRQGPIPRLRPNTELVSAGETHGRHMACIVYEWRPDVLPFYVDEALERLLETMHDGQAWRIRLPLPLFQLAAGLAPDDRPTRRESPTLPTPRRAATLVA